jgi:hypothetical protein
MTDFELAVLSKQICIHIFLEYVVLLHLYSCVLHFHYTQSILLLLSVSLWMTSRPITFVLTTVYTMRPVMLPHL